MWLFFKGASAAFSVPAWSGWHAGISSGGDNDDLMMMVMMIVVMIMVGVDIIY